MVYAAAARPKPGAANLMGICFLRYPIRKVWDTPRVRRCVFPGEARHGQIEATPEKMNRTTFPYKARAKNLKYAINLN